jgi:hypothetical protein
MKTKNYFTDRWTFMTPPSMGARSRLEFFTRKCRQLEDEFEECGIELVSFDYDTSEFSAYLKIVINTKYRQLLEEQAEDFYFFFNEHIPSYQTNEWEPVDWIRKPIPDGYMGCHVEVYEPHMILMINLDLWNKNGNLPTHDFMFLSSHPHRLWELTE